MQTDVVAPRPDCRVPRTLTTVTEAAWASGIETVATWAFICESESLMPVSKRDSDNALSSPPATTRDVASDTWTSSTDLMLFECTWYRLSQVMFSGVIEAVLSGCFMLKVGAEIK